MLAQGDYVKHEGGSRKTRAAERIGNILGCRLCRQKEGPFRFWDSNTGRSTWKKGHLQVKLHSRSLILAGQLLLATTVLAAAQQNYCVDPGSGKRVEAGSTITRERQLLRCCRRAPVSGVSSKAAFLKEETFKKILRPHRCWSTGLRTRDFVSAKIPAHPRRGPHRG